MPKSKTTAGGEPHGYSSLIGSGATFAGVDQGIDFTGRAPVFALSDGEITRLEHSGSGWPGEGALLVYKMTSGPRKGKYVYTAEDFEISQSLNVKSTISRGQTIGIATGAGLAPGIETGWCDAEGHAFGTLNGPQPEGNDFNNFVQGLPSGEVGGSTSEASGKVTSTVSIQEVEATAKAAAFSTYLEIPGLFDGIESQALKGQRSLMNDKPLIEFIEQLCQASLRRFQSMPNGNFYAFYPDYFGGLEHHTPYWEIHDIEILDGKINLNDEALATHVYVVGDSVGNYDGINEADLISSSGVCTLFHALAANFITGFKEEPKKKATKKERQASAAENKQHALNFLKKYGARPFFEEAPMVRSGFYEMFLAFQRFCLLWSKQFLTEFELTYMPELFPGGLVALPEHGLQLFVEEVNHEFDYENGFTTTASFSAPTALENGPAGLHDGMIRADALKPTTK